MVRDTQDNDSRVNSPAVRWMCELLIDTDQWTRECAKYEFTILRDHDPQYQLVDDTEETGSNVNLATARSGLKIIPAW